MTAQERVAASLSAIAAEAHLAAFWAVDGDRALRAARAVDGRQGRAAHDTPLAGMPVGIKDCFDVAGLPTTCGVRGPAAPAVGDSEVVRRLRVAGAVPVGKTAMDQLGWGTSGIAPGHPACRNPRDASRTPGGSSSGSAVAVAASLVPLAIGTDTAGSLRIPASYCGVVGFKPGLRALPGSGAAAVVRSLETTGVLARTVADCRTAYEVLRGQTLPAASAARLSIGRLDDLFEIADPGVAAVAGRALDALPAPHRVLATRLDWRLRGLGRLLAAELAMSWGSRIRAEPERFADDVREGAQRGAAITPSERQALLRELRAARRRLRQRLAGFDVVASPTVPHPVPPAGQDTVDASTRFTRPFNALGWPAISVPCGTDARGLPIGLQLAAPPGGVAELFAAAAAVETHHHAHQGSTG